MQPKEAEHKKGPVTKLREELEKTKQEAKANYDNYLRAVAEFDNYRKRVQKENEEFKEYAQASLLLDLVPVLENFDRALSHVESGELITTKEKNNSNESQPALGESDNNSNQLNPNWLKGVKIIYNQIKEILAKYGFQEYSCLGEEFDPRKCEAISFIETNEKPPNLVFEQTGKGYTLKGKILRPALVIVTKPKPETGQIDQQENPEGE
ncbi:MAG: nucleotide exchange factor GrpE [bacterium]|nr:nucleotide exchange factor GrpE [candidate division WOR-3 bacterium]MDH5683064.1 nucleotide exchange factor GrpE [candidate division WOR-3 bacterium]